MESTLDKFLILLLIFPIKAMAIEDGLNLREMCREDVADVQLDLNNKLTLEQVTIKHSKTKLERARLEVISTKEELKLLHKKQEVENFNYQLEQTILGKEYQQQQAVELEKSYKKMLSKSSENVVKADRKLKAFEKVIKPVFYKKQVEKDSDGYKFQLEYRRSCPKHNIVCPLSQEDKKNFKKILAEIKDKEACKRYINIETYEP